MLHRALGSEYDWDGARWRRRERGWKDEGGVFFCEARWQSGRGLLFDAYNPWEGDSTASYLLDPIPSTFSQPVQRSATLLATKLSTKPARAIAWIGPAGRRAVVRSPATGENELLVDDRRVATPAEPGSPVYVRRDGRVIAGVRENKDRSFVEPATRLLLCERSGCTPSDPAPGPISFVREIGAALYAFGQVYPAPYRVHRLEGTRWVTAGTFPPELHLEPLGDGDDTSLLLLTRGPHGTGVARWTP